MNKKTISVALVLLVLGAALIVGLYERTHTHAFVGGPARQTRPDELIVTPPDSNTVKRWEEDRKKAVPKSVFDRELKLQKQNEQLNKPNM
jgi:hypothetical protein